MLSRSREQSCSLLPVLAMLAVTCGCQSTQRDSSGLAIPGGRAPQMTLGAARGDATPSAAAASSPSVNSVGDYDDVSAPGDARRAGELAYRPRHVTLASYRDPGGSNPPAESRRSPAPGNHLAAGGRSALALSFTTLQDQPSGSGGDGGAPSSTEGGQAQHGGESLEEINNKLNNPGADLASLNFKLAWNQYKGDLPGSSSQNSLSLNFEPVFPFKLSDGGTFLVRPSFPLVWQPHFNARSGGFDEQFGMGDSQLVAFYSRTDIKKGLMWGAGLTMQFPTHTDDVLGNDAFQIGPAAFVGLMGKWGSVGIFPQHWWNIGGGDGYTSFTAVQPWYWFSVGKGYQIGGSPTITYDWAADDSDNAWTVPINLGVAKTIMVGKTPVKLKFEGIYYAEQPDDFGPHWGLQFTITPVIKNPFERHGT